MSPIMTLESLLKQIGRHPFVSVHQLCRMLDASKSWVYERLGEVEELVEKVNPRHPGVSARALYYLTPEGEDHLSLPRRRGRPAFLPQIAMVYEVRNFFISIQKAGLPVSCWQVLAPATLGASLHGAATTVEGQRLILEWDRGERPATLYRDRLRHVADIAEDTGSGLLLVAADGMRGTTMLSILISGYLDMQGPHLALTTRSAVAAGVREATCYVPALTNTISLGGFVETLPQPWGKELPISPGVRGYSGQWRGNSHLVVELSPLQKELLSFLAGLPLITIEDLAMLSARSDNEEWVRRCLIDLKERGLAEEYIRDPHLLHRHYFITYAGLSFLAACCGTTARAYARARGWSVRDALGDRVVSVSHLARIFEHTQEVREVALALAQEAARRDQTITWYDEREARVYFTRYGERKVLAPDARIHWGEHVLFVEVDRGTYAVTRLMDRLETYYDFRARAEHRRFGNRLRLLVVAPQENQRDRQWLWQASRLANRRDAPPLDLLVTNREAMRKHGIGAPIWRGVGNEDRKVGFLE